MRRRNRIALSSTSTATSSQKVFEDDEPTQNTTEIETQAVKTGVTTPTKKYKRKRVSLVKEEVVDENTNPNPVTPVKPKREKKKQVKRKRTNDEEEATSTNCDDDDVEGRCTWTEEQLECLQVAIATVAPSEIAYWNEVAKYVPNKSALECQIKYQAIFKTPTTNRTKRRRKNDTSPDLAHFDLSEIRGKLKKKRAIRDVLNKADKQHRDDLFDSSPYKNIDPQTSTMIEALFADDEASDYEQTYSKLLHANGISEETVITPCKDRMRVDELQTMVQKLSPGILRPVNSEDVDTYVNRLKLSRATAGGSKSRRKSTAVSSKPTAEDEDNMSTDSAKPKKKKIPRGPSLDERIRDLKVESTEDDSQDEEEELELSEDE